MPEQTSEIFKKGNHAFGSKDGFDAAFPEIQGMSIHVVELECLVWMKEQATHHLTAESPGGAHIDCTNPSCSDGGFSVGDMLREAVKNKEEKIEKCTACTGSETSGRRCFHAFTVSGSVKYKV
ncbi:MAG: hypothetical protein KFB92_15900 [Alcanivorax sp.]|jgi:hypothetical protein|nr:MAG: hypothetical protein KFB92_15900 [Alcanivorax sp.]